MEGGLYLWGKEKGKGPYCWTSRGGVATEKRRLAGQTGVLLSLLSHLEYQLELQWKSLGRLKCFQGRNLFSYFPGLTLIIILYASQRSQVASRVQLATWSSKGNLDVPWGGAWDLANVCCIPSLAFRGSEKFVCEGFLSFRLFYLLDFFWAWEMGERMEPDEILSNGHQP